MFLLWLSLVAVAFVYYLFTFYRTVAKYPPGPFPWPLVGNLLQLDAINTHKHFDRLSEKYGPVFTVFFPRPIVIITKLPEIREALIKNGETFSGRPDCPLTEVFHAVENGGVIQSEGVNWREQRRFALTTMRDFGMGKNIMEQKVLDSVITMFDQLDAMSHQSTIDMNWPLQLCVGNIINELLLGYHWKPDNCDKFMLLKQSTEALLKMMRERPLVMFVNSYPWLKHVPIIGYNGYGELREQVVQLHNFVRGEIQEHRVQHNDLLDVEPTDVVGAYLVELNKRQQTGDFGSFSEQNLVNVVTDFWLAGMETTATTLRWAIMYLIHDGDVQKRVQDEIDAVIGRDRLPSMADKVHMPYTTAMIMELQRKANIVTFNVGHKTFEDVVIGGHHIPKGAFTMPQISSVLSDPQVFPEPDKFDPGRFVESGGVSRKKEMDHLVPFSLGKRQCAGEGLAKLELFLILVAILQRYSFQVPQGGQLPDLTPIYGATLIPLPYECKVVRRL